MVSEGLSGRLTNSLTNVKLEDSVPARATRYTAQKLPPVQLSEIGGRQKDGGVSEDDQVSAHLDASAWRQQQFHDVSCLDNF